MKNKDVQVSSPDKDIVYKGNRCKFVLQDAVDFMNRKPQSAFYVIVCFLGLDQFFNVVIIKIICLNIPFRAMYFSFILCYTLMDFN